ncbi:dynein light chain Tctex-type 5-B-like [Cololabis saira]|uniref:dynein light chain Tctex-type 5-B-like n=1 Tax=Cololabis saira TaxID=129043 RepID=UPI002AD28FF9|nr:dynein light chain Tctex-type 5-B-like [Cololabis saira]
MFFRSVSTVCCRDEPEHHDDSKKVENTYQLGPLKRFPVSAATEILRDVLTSHLQEEKHEVQPSPELIITLTGGNNKSTIIKSLVKELEVPRYQILVVMHLDQLSDQGLHNISSFLWDANYTFASFSFNNSSLFCVATVYAVYHE